MVLVISRMEQCFTLECERGTGKGTDEFERGTACPKEGRKGHTARSLRRIQDDCSPDAFVGDAASSTACRRQRDWLLLRVNRLSEPVRTRILGSEVTSNFR